MITTDSEAPVGFSLPVRIIGWILALVVGGVFGCLGTVMHQAVLDLDPIPVPYGYLLAVGAIVLLLLGLRFALPNRIAAALAAAGVITVVGVFALKSPGGSVLIPANLLGYLWTFTPTVVALGALLWPLRRAR